MFEAEQWRAPMFAGLVTALLPAPERDRLARQWGVDPVPWSFGLGLVQSVLGSLLFLVGAHTFAVGPMPLSRLLIESWIPGLVSEHFRGSGRVLLWFFHPMGWLYAGMACMGVLRCIVWTSTREAVGEPAVWAVLRAVQGIRDRRSIARRERHVGPVRPDRVVEQDDGSVIVVACREKPEWNERVTIKLGDGFYRLLRVEERPDGPYAAIAYHLNPVESNHVIRRLLSYTPPF